MKKLLWLWLALLPAGAEPPTYCNPIDLDYRYNFEQQNEGISYRSGADPVLIAHQGQYYLFVTISGGWWRSPDLRHWTFVQPDHWPYEDICAPAAWSTGKKMFLFQSTFQQRPIMEVVDPRQGKLAFYQRWLPLMKGADGPWDPALFCDPDTQRWFLYFGSSNVFPLYGIELDPRRQLNYLGSPRGLLTLDPDQHGWERFGQDHRDTIQPFMEGAWMTKQGGKYYLQYGAPGTEYNVYATGTYVGEDPLGPFVYANYNPVAYKPGGFACGIGHGNTFQDLSGNWWMTGTCWIGLNWGMERRLMMVPAGFDRDGQMFADTRFGDFPHWMPEGRRKGDTFTGWMLLSRGKPLRASSQATPEHPPAHAADENLRTYWLAAKAGAGQWLEMDLQRVCQVRAVQVNYADVRSGVFKNEGVYTDLLLWGSQDGHHWHELVDTRRMPRRDRPNAYLPLTSPASIRFLRFEHQHIAGAHLAIADLRVFGRAPGAVPARPLEVRARRDSDRRNAVVSWAPVKGAVGYNVRWGIAANKLYQTYQVWAEPSPSVEIRALNLPQGYCFAVEAFNESGVSPLSAVDSAP